MTYFAAVRCPHCGTYHLLGTQCNCRTKLPPVIIGKGSFDDQVSYAICCVCGEDRVVPSVQLISQHLGRGFPESAKEFAVLSESSECERDPRCQWFDNVYWYRDRRVVIKHSQLSMTLLGNVLMQLKGK